LDFYKGQSLAAQNFLDKLKQKPFLSPVSQAPLGPQPDYSHESNSCHPLSYEMASCQSLVQSSNGPSESPSASVASSFLNILSRDHHQAPLHHVTGDPLRQSEVLLQSLYQRITGPAVRLNLSRGQLQHSKLSAKRRDQLLGIKRKKSLASSQKDSGDSFDNIPLGSVTNSQKVIESPLSSKRVCCPQKTSSSGSSRQQPHRRQPLEPRITGFMNLGRPAKKCQTK